MPLYGQIIVIKRNGADGYHFPLMAPSCLFGRKIDCDIRIQLPHVSKEHCKLEVNENNEVILSNLSDVNRTSLNGKVVLHSERLQHGDVFTIIDRSFRFEYPLDSGHFTDTRIKRNSSSLKNETLQGGEHGVQPAQNRRSLSGHTSDAVCVDRVFDEPIKPTKAKPDSWEDEAPKRQQGRSSADIKDEQPADKEVSPFSKLYEMCKNQALQMHQKKTNIELSNKKNTETTEKLLVLPAEESKANIFQGSKSLRTPLRSRRMSQAAVEESKMPKEDDSDKEGMKNLEASLVQDIPSKCLGKTAVNKDTPKKRCTSVGLGEFTENLSSEENIALLESSKAGDVQDKAQNDCQINAPKSKRKSHPFTSRKSLNAEEVLKEIHDVLGSSMGKKQNVVEEEKLTGKDDTSVHVAEKIPETPKRCGRPSLQFSQIKVTEIQTEQPQFETPEPITGATSPAVTKGKRNSSFSSSPLLNERGEGAVSCPSRKRRSENLEERLCEPVSKQKRVSFGVNLCPEVFDKRMPPNSPLRKGGTPRKFSIPLSVSANTALKRASNMGLHSCITEELTEPCKRSSKLSTVMPVKSNMPPAGHVSTSPKETEMAVKNPSPARRSPAARSPALGKKSPGAKTPSPGRKSLTAKTPSPGRKSLTAQTPSPGRKSLAAQSPSPERKSLAAKTPSPGRKSLAAQSPSRGRKSLAAQSPSQERKSLAAKTPSPGRKSLAAKTPSPGRKSLAAKTPSPGRKSLAAKTPSPGRKSLAAKTPSPGRKSLTAKTPSPGRKSLAAKTPSPGRKSLAAKTPSPGRKSLAAQSPSPDRNSLTPKSPSLGRKSLAAKSPSPGRKSLAAKSPSQDEMSPAAKTPSPGRKSFTSSVIKKSPSNGPFMMKISATLSAKRPRVAKMPCLSDTKKLSTTKKFSPLATKMSTAKQLIRSASSRSFNPSPSVCGRFSVSRTNTPPILAVESTSQVFPASASPKLKQHQQTTNKLPNFKTTPSRKSARRSASLAAGLYSRRQSGASVANLLVKKSWAQVVKEGVAKSEFRSAPKKRVVMRRQIKNNSSSKVPKTPIRSVKGHYSTGHAVSPATIVIGKAQATTVKTTGMPPRTVTNVSLRRKSLTMDQSFTGVAEMFTTPTKKNRRASTRLRISSEVGRSQTITGTQVSQNSFEGSVIKTSEETGEMVISPLTTPGSTRRRSTGSLTCRVDLSSNSKELHVKCVNILKGGEEPTDDLTSRCTLLTSPEEKTKPVEDMVELKRPLKTPKVKGIPVVSIKQIMKTPKIKGGQEEDFARLQKLMAESKQKAKSPKVSYVGVKEMFHTTKVMETTDYSGLGEMFSTPKRTEETVESELQQSSNESGRKRATDASFALENAACDDGQTVDSKELSETKLINKMEQHDQEQSVTKAASRRSCRKSFSTPGIKLTKMQDQDKNTKSPPFSNKEYVQPSNQLETTDEFSKHDVVELMDSDNSTMEGSDMLEKSPNVSGVPIISTPTKVLLQRKDKLKQPEIKKDEKHAQIILVNCEKYTINSVVERFESKNVQAEVNKLKSPMQKSLKEKDETENVQGSVEELALPQENLTTDKDVSIVGYSEVNKLASPTRRSLIAPNVIPNPQNTEVKESCATIKSATPGRKSQGGQIKEVKLTTPTRRSLRRNNECENDQEVKEKELLAPKSSIIPDEQGPWDQQTEEISQLVSPSIKLREKSKLHILQDTEVEEVLIPNKTTTPDKKETQNGQAEDIIDLVPQTRRTLRGKDESQYTWKREIPSAPVEDVQELFSSENELMDQQEDDCKVEVSSSQKQSKEEDSATSKSKSVRGKRANKEPTPDLAKKSRRGRPKKVEEVSCLKKTVRWDPKLSEAVCALESVQEASEVTEFPITVPRARRGRLAHAQKVVNSPISLVLKESGKTVGENSDGISNTNDAFALINQEKETSKGKDVIFCEPEELSENDKNTENINESVLAMDEYKTVSQDIQSDVNLPPKKKMPRGRAAQKEIENKGKNLKEIKVEELLPWGQQTEEMSQLVSQSIKLRDKQNLQDAEVKELLISNKTTTLDKKESKDGQAEDIIDLVPQTRRTLRGKNESQNASIAEVQEYSAATKSTSPRNVPHGGQIEEVNKSSTLESKLIMYSNEAQNAPELGVIKSPVASALKNTKDESKAQAPQVGQLVDLTSRRNETHNVEDIEVIDSPTTPKTSTRGKKNQVSQAKKTSDLALRKRLQRGKNKIENVEEPEVAKNHCVSPKISTQGTETKHSPGPDIDISNTTAKKSRGKNANVETAEEKNTASQAKNYTRKRGTRGAPIKDVQELFASENEIKDQQEDDCKVKVSSGQKQSKEEDSATSKSTSVRGKRANKEPTPDLAKKSRRGRPKKVEEVSCLKKIVRWDPKLSEAVCALESVQEASEVTEFPITVPRARRGRLAHAQKVVNSPISLVLKESGKTVGENSDGISNTNDAFALINQEKETSKGKDIIFCEPEELSENDQRVENVNEGVLAVDDYSQNIQSDVNLPPKKKTLRGRAAQKEIQNKGKNLQEMSVRKSQRNKTEEKMSASTGKELHMTAEEKEKSSLPERRLRKGNVSVAMNKRGKRSKEYPVETSGQTEPQLDLTEVDVKLCAVTEGVSTHDVVAEVHKERGKSKRIKVLPSQGDDEIKVIQPRRNTRTGKSTMVIVTECVAEDDCAANPAMQIIEESSEVILNESVPTKKEKAEKTKSYNKRDKRKMEKAAIVMQEVSEEGLKDPISKGAEVAIPVKTPRRAGRGMVKNSMIAINQKVNGNITENEHNVKNLANEAEKYKRARRGNAHKTAAIVPVVQVEEAEPIKKRGKQSRLEIQTSSYQNIQLTTSGAEDKCELPSAKFSKPAKRMTRADKALGATDMVEESLQLSAEVSLTPASQSSSKSNLRGKRAATETTDAVTFKRSKKREAVDGKMTTQTRKLKTAMSTKEKSPETKKPQANQTRYTTRSRK
eukprot:gi/632936283/ref/XP_007894299.1/ PREDICTED: antigen KI-67 isoform X2 [Callorhinchus milii]